MSAVTTTCTCCGEAPVWSEAAEHGYELCSACSQNPICDQCGRDGCPPVPWWAEQVCERCAGRDARRDRLHALIHQIHSAARSGGWSVAERHAGTGTVYMELTRDELRDGQDDVVLTIRIGDHPANVRRFDGADYSLSIGEIGEAEYDVAQVIRRLMR